MVTYPKDWDVVELGKKCEVTSSKRVFESEWTKSGIPFLRTRDIASFQSGTDQKDKLFISESTYKEKTAVSGEPVIGDLLVTGVGTIGLPYLVSKVPMYFKDGNILWIKRSDSFVPQFLYLMFLAKDVKQQIEDGSGFTTVGTFTIKNAKKLSVPCPETGEQKSIAETLSCMDEHIANLTELIEKKKGIRDGALEDLVSGRTRLKGFSGEWEEKSLKELCYLITKQTGFDYSAEIKPSLVSSKQIGVLPFIQNKDFEKLQINYDTDFYIPQNIADRFPRILLNEVCLLISISGKIGNVGVFTNEHPAFAGGAVGIAKLYDPLWTEWCMYYLTSEQGQKQIFKNEKVGAQHNLTVADVRKLIIKLPSDKERDCITNILKSMDAEIAALEEEKDKMLQIKAGAMDDLLTGRVRLTRQGG